jgi:O-antigen/teichoic acid export membrane protein
MNIKFFKKILIAGGSKAASATTAFLLTAYITNALEIEEAGNFLLILSMLAIFSTFFRLGLDNIVLRELSANDCSEKAQETLNKGLVWVFFGVLPFCTLLMVFDSAISEKIFNKEQISDLIFWSALALPSMCVFMLMAMGFQSQRRFFFTTIYQNFGVSILFLVTALVYSSYFTIDALIAVKIYTISAWAVLISAMVLWYGQKKIIFCVGSVFDKKMFVSSWRLWLASTMSLITQWSSMFIAGILLTSQEVAFFSSAFRAALVITFILMVVNMVVTPIYAKQWKNNDLIGMAKLSHKSSRLMVLIVLPLFFVVLFQSERIMTIFGPEYGVAGSILLILALGQFINVATGSVGYLLNMTGHEKSYSNVTVACAFFFQSYLHFFFQNYLVYTV